MFCSATTKQNKNSKFILEGYVVAKGNVPFIYPVIETEDGITYRISEKTKIKTKKILNLQGNLVRFTGKIEENGNFIIKKYKVLK